MTETTIDITPEGAKTPEGRARIDRAVETQRETDSRCRQLLSELVGEHGAELDAALTCKDGRELLAEIRSALDLVSAAGFELVCAIAGRHNTQKMG